MHTSLTILLIGLTLGMCIVNSLRVCSVELCAIQTRDMFNIKSSDKLLQWLVVAACSKLHPTSFLSFWYDYFYYTISDRNLKHKIFMQCTKPGTDTQGAMYSSTTWARVHTARPQHHQARGRHPGSHWQLHSVRWQWSLWVFSYMFGP